MTLLEHSLNFSSLWLIAALVLALLVIATESGFRIHRHKLSRKTPVESGSGNSTFPLFGAALGLLALILGFSFSMALDRFDQRRMLVLEEANAIGTLELRARLLPSVTATALHPLIIGYVDARLEYFAAAGDSALQAKARVDTEAKQQQLWDVAKEIANAAPQSQVTGLFISALNEAFDLATARRTAFAAHLPPSVIGMVLLYALICAGILGYALADTGRRHLGMSSLLLLLVTLVITIIIDIDRPRSGTVVVDVRPLEDVRQALSSAP
jgi:hypothetical protein